MVEMAEKNNLEELDIQFGKFKVSIRRNGARPRQEGSTVREAAAQVISSEKSDLHEVRSPLGGVFYSAPGPGQPPFVQVGQGVAPGQPLCIIEAMKTMNEISSDIKGEVREILVENGSSVETGQVLFHLKPVPADSREAGR